MSASDVTPAEEADAAAWPKPELPLGLLTAFVCVAGGLMGAGFGEMGGMLAAGAPETPPFEVAGAAAGGAIGVLCGLIWSGMMARSTRQRIGETGRVSGGLIGSGIGWGVFVGFIATVLLWTVLVLMRAYLEPPRAEAERSWSLLEMYVMSAGMATLWAGAPGGLLTGLLCSIPWKRACAEAWRKQLATEKEEVAGG